MHKLTHGEPTSFPWDYEHMLIAARFGMDPDRVAEWPAAKYLRAAGLIPCLALVGLPGDARDG